MPKSRSTQPEEETDHLPQDPLIRIAPEGEAPVISSRVITSHRLDQSRLPERCGDIYFHDGKFYVGKKYSSTVGSLNTKSGLALIFLLANLNRDVSHEELSEVTESINPNCFAQGLRSQLLINSDCYNITARRVEKIVRMDGAPPLPHDADYYIRTLTA